MDAVLSTSVDPSVFDANVSALADVLPAAAEAVRAADLPATLEETLGRDGSLTYAWREADGTLRWLGRTSMPSVSGPALVEAFQPGGGNVLLYAMGQGIEARLLLERLGRHQAVMVVEPNAFAAALTLRLHDFAAAIRTGRLLLFVGADAWDHIQDYLIAHPGYLEPQRVLSWPWFDADAIAKVTKRLGAVNAAVGAARMASRAATGRTDKTQTPTLAILSGVGQAGTWQAAARMADAAAAMGWEVESFVMDDPSRVHPYAVEAALARKSSLKCLMIDTPPGGAGFRLPECPTCVWWTANTAPAADFLAQMGAGSVLAVTMTSVRDAVERAGFDAARVVVMPPAACASAAALEDRSGHGVVVIADGGEVSAMSVGLNLATHARLWDMAVEVVRERCDRYVDDDADELLRIAEQRLKLRVESDEVRRGLTARMRQRMGAVVTRAYLTALRESGAAFELFGNGWADEKQMAEHWRGEWPAPRRLGEQFGGGSVIVCMESSGRLRAEVLDAMAMGFAAVVRRHSRDATDDGLGAVLDAGSHVRRYQTRAELIEIVRGAAKDTRLREMAKTARAHVRGGHTWVERLRSVLGQF